MNKEDITKIKEEVDADNTVVIYDRNLDRFLSIESSSELGAYAIGYYKVDEIHHSLYLDDILEEIEIYED